jgi:hypothetical protein
VFIGQLGQKRSRGKHMAKPSAPESRVQFTVDSTPTDPVRLAVLAATGGNQIYQLPHRSAALVSIEYRPD